MPTLHDFFTRFGTTEWILAAIAVAIILLFNDGKKWLRRKKKRREP